MADGRRWTSRNKPQHGNGSLLLLALAAVVLGILTLLVGVSRPRPAVSQAPATPPVWTPEPVMQETAPTLTHPEPTPTLPDQAEPPLGVAQVYTDPYDQLYSEYYRHLQQLIALSNDPYLHLVVRPLENPSMEINFGGNRLQNAASTLKSPVLLYAIFRDPSIALSGWAEGMAREAYRMIVGSNNTSTGNVLGAVSTDGPTAALNEFNLFLHDIIGLPATVGLTHWNYGQTSGVTSVQVYPSDTIISREDVLANPYSLDAMVAFYEFMETPAWIEGAINRANATPGYPLRGDYPSSDAYRQAVLAGIEEARALMAVPDPEFVTELERALARAQAAYPDVTISMYGKNGTLRPEDWPGERWHVIEGVVVTATRGDRSQRCVIAYSASHFDNDRLLDAAFTYCVVLFNQVVAGR